MNMAATAFCRIPGASGIARILSSSRSLRCIVFHNVSPARSPFTDGIRVNTSPKQFETALRFVVAHYAPVHLQDVIAKCGGPGLPAGAILVTFDDAYASVVEWAAPLCRQFGVPAVFFVNAAFIDNKRLAPDNLVCYVANVLGMDTINAAIRTVAGKEKCELHSLAEVFGTLFPTISLTQREIFLDALRRLAGINESTMASRANLYLSSRQVRELRSFDFEIGNHTYTHTHCRMLSRQELVSEVTRNKSELEALSGMKIRSFSQPYGSSKDITQDLLEHLRCSGHQAVFLSESVSNPQTPNLFHLDRVSTCAENDETLSFEIDVLPRLRTIRNQLLQNSCAH
jgi:peptidoglycan/xylan/chitin deacetylase (PgdA/CDA1 family)